MSHSENTQESVLFVYSKDHSGTFWVYDGAQYHRFWLDQQRFWYVRSQSYLPAYCTGSCAGFSPEERQLLEWEAYRYGITLPFFDSDEECYRYFLTAGQDQHVFDSSFPAGFFQPDNDLHRREEDE